MGRILISCTILVAVIAKITPPSELASQYTAFFRLHSASPYAKGSYYEGQFAIDVLNGAYRTTGLNCEGIGCSNEDSLTLCNGVPGNRTAIQVYVSNQSSTPCEHIPVPNCPVTSEYALPSDATYQGSETVNGVLCNQWSFFDAGLGSEVNAWIMKLNNSDAPPLIRFIAARVQHDYFNVSIGPPGKKAIEIPAVCG